MSTRVSKRVKENAKLVERDRAYKLDDAMVEIKKLKTTKFDESIDIHVKLAADPNASDQVVRGTVVLPHGTGRKVRVVVLTKDEAGKDAQAAGAELVGGDDLIAKILGGWMEFDVLIASPSMMKDIAKLGRVLGPRGLMPSPKAGTVTDKLGDAVKEIKKGRIEFKMDKQGNVNASVGKHSFQPKALTENGLTFLRALAEAKPKGVKGDFFKTAYLSTTMGPSWKIDLAPILKEMLAEEA